MHVDILDCLSMPNNSVSKCVFKFIWFCFIFTSFARKHGVFLLICLFLLITKVFIKFKRILFDKNIILCTFKSHLHDLPTYLPTYQSASCISALAARLVRILQTLRSWAATSASSIVQPNPRLRRSLWMTSIHFVPGRPRLRLPWDGFHRCSFFGIRLLSNRSRWPNQFSLRFLV